MRERCLVSMSSFLLFFLVFFLSKLSQIAPVKLCNIDFSAVRRHCSKCKVPALAQLNLSGLLSILNVSIGFVPWMALICQEKRLFPSAHLVRILAVLNVGLGVLYMQVCCMYCISI